MLTFLLNNKDDECLIDSDFNAFLICDIIHLKAKELLPLIKTFFDQGLVAESICGDFNSVENDIIRQPELSYCKYDLYNIYDRYTHILTKWAGYQEGEKDLDESDLNGYGDELSDYQPEDLIRFAPKIGRNNPCPCGSGKKYKTCCGRK